MIPTGWTFRYRQKVNGVLQPFTGWIPIIEGENAFEEYVPKVKATVSVLRVGNLNIPKQYLEIKDNHGNIIKNPSDFTKAVEPNTGFPYTFPYNLA